MKPLSSPLLAALSAVLLGVFALGPVLAAAQDEAMEKPGIELSLPSQASPNICAYHDADSDGRLDMAGMRQRDIGILS